MKTIISKYNFTGGFSLLLLMNFIWGILTYSLLSNLKLETIKKMNINELPFFIIILLVQICFLNMFRRNCKIIFINKNGMTFINPLLPFIRTKKIWSDFDYYKIKVEHNRVSEFETLWLFKDNKLEYKISKFYYRNFYQIKAGIKLKSNGKLNLTLWQNITSLFGYLKINQK